MYTYELIDIDKFISLYFSIYPPIYLYIILMKIHISFHFIDFIFSFENDLSLFFLLNILDSVLLLPSVGYNGLNISQPLFLWSFFQFIISFFVCQPNTLFADFFQCINIYFDSVSNLPESSCLHFGLFSSSIFCIFDLSDLFILASLSDCSVISISRGSISLIC